MKIRHYLWNESLSKLHQIKLGKKSQEIILRPSTRLRNFTPFGYRQRELLESLLPVDFESNYELKFTTGIVSSVQEIDLLPLSTEALISTHDGMLKEKILVAPADQIRAISKVIPGEFQCLSDEDLLPAPLAKQIDSNTPPNRRGWIRQQLLKILLTNHLGGHGTLLVDADTILLRRQKWISADGKQNLQISSEYHLPYQLHLEKFMLDLGRGSNIPEQRIRASFVTHHQFMQPKVLESIFANDGLSLHDGLLRWVKAIDFEQSNSPACEWHTYGTYLAMQEPERIQLTQWKNIGVSRNSKSKYETKSIKELTVPEIIREFTGFNSVSLHHYIP
jgi:hypothetical protein